MHGGKRIGYRTQDDLDLDRNTFTIIRSKYLVLQACAYAAAASGNRFFR
jgi:hypothetical protein